VQEFQKYVRSNLPSTRPRILEIGSGTGEYTREIAEIFPDAYILGIDISGKILKIAKKKCKGLKNVTFETVSAYETGLTEKSFDVICGFYVLHHLDLRRFRQEFVRLLKPSGLGFFYEPNILNPAVFLIKSIPYLKEKSGDSPDEWGVNPLNAKKIFRGFSIETSTSEFILPLKSLPLPFLKKMDKLLGIIGKIPVLKYLGGSVILRLRLG
jgi:ubiquinone/menaquinone biosynthesis C-methylase UbiE